MAFAGKTFILSIFLLGALSTTQGLSLPSFTGVAGLIFNATFEGIHDDWAPANVTQKGVSQQCLDTYNSGVANAMQTTGADIRQCVNATNDGLEAYFNSSSIESLRETFFTHYTNCIAILIPFFNLECITYGLVQSFSTAGYNSTLQQQACIAVDIQSGWYEVHDSDRAFLNCMGRGVISSILGGQRS